MDDENAKNDAAEITLYIFFKVGYAVFMINNVKQNQAEYEAIQRVIAVNQHEKFNEPRYDYLIEQHSEPNVIIRLITEAEAERIRQAFFGVRVTGVER